MKISKENLFFDVYWMGIYVGKASFEAKNESDHITITSRINSAPFISNLYRVEDFAQSVIFQGKPVNFKIKQHEGRYRSNKETVFDIENGKITYFNHLKGERYDHQIPNNQPLWDIISGFYYLRTFKLKVGTSVFINIFDSNKFYNAEVKIIGKEKLKITENWESETLIIKPILLTEGLFKRRGDIKIWLTDDEYKIPVKVETSISIGKVIAKIRSIETMK
ncbi:MAG: DUF3108 domain-containing protein [Thermodesulfovibrionales bacterium]|nr:DUF3108 domain-containing protein [Thermodesulfovibrionales bacterium]